MNEGEVHFRVGKRYACGIGRRWLSQNITSTILPSRVTCGGCKRSVAYKEATTHG